MVQLMNWVTVADSLTLLNSEISRTDPRKTKVTRFLHPSLPLVFCNFSSLIVNRDKGKINWYRRDAVITESILLPSKLQSLR